MATQTDRLEVQTFHEDCIQLAQEQLAKGRLDRRSFLAGMASLGAMAGMSSAAVAQVARDIVMVNWGGLANQAFGDFYGKPFEAKNPGFKVVQDSSGPSQGKIRAMVEANKVTWDLCDSSASSSIFLGKAGLLSPIDYSIVDKSLLPAKGFAYPFGAAPYSFSTIMVYDAVKFKDDPPKTWADFWDLKKYPGKRMLRKDVNCMIDAAVMSAGTPLDKVYPIDEKLAWAQLKKIKDQAVYWTSGTDSEQIMRTGEASMGILWHTRAKVLFEESKGKFDFTWNQGILQPGIFVSPKNNPAGKDAMRLLRSMQEPEPQVGLLRFFGNGPTNPKAIAMVPDELKRFDPMNPENAKGQIVYDGDWYGENYVRMQQEYLDFISS